MITDLTLFSVMVIGTQSRPAPDALFQPNGMTPEPIGSLMTCRRINPVAPLFKQITGSFRLIRKNLKNKT